MNKVSAISLKSYVYQMLSVGISAINVKLCLKLFGDSGYSGWVLLLSLINICYALDLGAGSAIRNALAKGFSEKNTLLSQAGMVVSYYKQVAVLALILFAIIFLIGGFKYIFGWYISFSFFEYSTVLALVFIDFILRAHHPIFAGIQQPQITNLALALSQLILYLCLQLILIPNKDQIHDKLFVFAVTTVFISILVNFIFLIWLNSVLPVIRGLLNSGVFLNGIEGAKIINREGFSFFLMQITFTLLGQVTGYFVYAKFSPEYLVDISIAEKVFAPLIVGATILMYPFWSVYTVMWHRGEFDRIRILIRRQESLSIAGVLLLGLCCLFYDKIILIWLEREVNNYFIPCFIALKVFAIIINSVYSYFMNGIGAVKPQIFVYSVGFLVSLVVLYLGCLYNNIYVCLSVTPLVFLSSAVIQRSCIYRKMLSE